MKKHLKIYLGIILIFVILVVCAIVFYYQNKKINDSPYGTMTYSASNNTYTVSYTASYNHDPVLNDSKKYEIVTKKNKLNHILKKINSSDLSEFNDDFFKSQNLLVIPAGIDPEIHELNIKDTEVDISIYEAVPFTSEDQMWTFSLYLIPINKNINNCNVETSSYPDRIY